MSGAILQILVSDQETVVAVTPDGMLVLSLGLLFSIILMMGILGIIFPIIHR
jgi:hypothetical protein